MPSRFSWHAPPRIVKPSMRTLLAFLMPTHRIAVGPHGTALPLTVSCAPTMCAPHFSLDLSVIRLVISTRFV